MAKAGKYKVVSSLLTLTDPDTRAKTRYRRGSVVDLNEKQANRFTISGTRGPAVEPIVSEIPTKSTSSTSSTGSSTGGSQASSSSKPKEDGK